MKRKNNEGNRCDRFNDNAHHQTIIGNDFETVYVQAGQDAQELVHVKIKFKNVRTRSKKKILNLQ